MFLSAPTDPPKPSARTATLPIARSVFVTRARVVLVQDVGGGERVDVRPRRIAIVGAEDIEDLLGAFRSGEPGRDPRLDRRPVRPDKYFSRARQ